MAAGHVPAEHVVRVTKHMPAGHVVKVTKRKLAGHVVKVTGFFGQSGTLKRTCACRACGSEAGSYLRLKDFCITQL